MIYLSEPNLLFLKPKKVAGTSIEVAFSCNASTADIVTPLTPVDEKIRYERGGQFPVNWAKDPEFEKTYRARFDAYLLTGVLPKRWMGLKKSRLYRKTQAKVYNHITPAQMKKADMGDLLQTARIVTICRDPYEQLVSYASHLARDKGKSVEKMIEKALSKRPINDAFYFGGGEPEFILRYETLSEDLTKLEKEFGLKLIENLPFTKNKARKDRRPARETLSEDQKARCQALYGQSFDTFGYER